MSWLVIIVDTFKAAACGYLSLMSLCFKMFFILSMEVFVGGNINMECDVNT